MSLSRLKGSRGQSFKAAFVAAGNRSPSQQTPLCCQLPLKDSNLGDGREDQLKLMESLR